MHKLCIVALACIIGCWQTGFGQQATGWKHLPTGSHTVGFKTMQKVGKQNKQLSIGLWYPAENGGPQMTLKDYILQGPEARGVNDTAILNDFKSILELRFLYHLSTIARPDLETAIGVSLAAHKNAKRKKGRYPLVVTFGSPSGYPETFEFLASHGFVVACVGMQLDQPANDTLLYVQATAILEEFIEMMRTENYIDTTRITAFGHGWGIQPPFYAAMRAPAIKLLVNLDGGVFGPRSKTPLSPDYAPSKLAIPMLHIVTQSTDGEDDVAQFNALSNTIYKLLINSPAVAHHDFTVYGRVVDLGLHKRGEGAAVAEEVYTNVHNLILYFLQHGQLDKTVVPGGMFTYTEWNKK